MREETIAQRNRILEQWHSVRRVNAGEVPHAPQGSHCAEDRPLATCILTIGGSAGACEALIAIAEALPRNFPAAIALVLHGHGGNGAAALQLRSSLPVRWVSNSEILRAGCVYLPRPDTHLIVNPDRRIAVSYAPRLRFCRPSVDWLFASAAATFGRRQVAVVLSGRLQDGAKGAVAVSASGGRIFVQDPTSSPFGGMPSAAVRTGRVTRIDSTPNLCKSIVEAFDELPDESEDEWQNPFSAS